jgi:hypothetical protein
VWLARGHEIFRPLAGAFECGLRAVSDLADLGEAADPLSSLVLYRQTLPGSRHVSAGQDPQKGTLRKRCPKKEGWWLVNTSTGERVPAGCGAAKCSVCAHGAAIRTAGAIGLSAPERFVTLTQVGEDWPTRRARMNRLAYELRTAIGQPVEMAYCVEANPRVTGHHSHAWQRGAFVPQKLLSRLADSVGMGKIVDIRKWEPKGSLAEGYGIKGLMYGLKVLDAGGESGHEKYLRENGNRLVHASKDYWRNKDGKRCGVAEARRDWMRLRGGDDKWVLVHSLKWELAKSTEGGDKDE